MKDETIITIVAIISIAVLETTALNWGIDGNFFGLAIAIISGLAGYKIGTFINNNKKKIL